MALWKDISAKENTPEEAPRHAPVVDRPRPEPIAAVPAAGQKPRKEMKETIIASGLTFEGKIEGSGHVRISGRFKGDISVDGTLTIEPGAHLAGSVRAASVVIAGELEGNVDGAERVELQATASVTGDVTAGSLTVAAGAKMRGRSEFGWSDSASQKTALRG